MSSEVVAVTHDEAKAVLHMHWFFIRPSCITSSGNGGYARADANTGVFLRVYQNGRLTFEVTANGVVRAKRFEVIP